MFIPEVNIEISLKKFAGKKVRLNFVNRGFIESSWTTGTDRASITVPRRLYVAGKRLNDQVTIGDKVTIDLGYKGYSSNREFIGFITKSDAKTPVTFTLEDYMWLLKKGSYTKGYVNTTLKQVVNDLAAYYNSSYSAGIKIKAVDCNIGNFRIKEASGFMVLQKLGEIYGFTSYFKGDTLYVGFARGTDLYKSRKVNYKHAANIINADLVFETKEQRKIQIKATSLKSNGTRFETTVGDKEGEVRNRFFYNISTQAELKKLAEAEHARNNYDGLSGSFRSFGIPFIEHSDHARIKNDEYPEWNGTYVADSVRTDFGTTGIKRTIKLGLKIA